MTTPIRVRFAPSPTGYLHVGGARTALYNWLYARKVGGKFLLRIEDTDRERSSDAHTQVILDGLTWLGLDWDEDLVFQGARVARHQEVADSLLASGHAYAEEGAVRFRMPQGEIAWEDFVHRRISFQGSDIKDWVILRSDRTPTYNFSVVVDDVDMRISHVMRGDDHISNTPKQIAVYQAMGVALPSFGHVPMIHGMDGKKLSKRHGATAVGDYQGMGILPEAMRNFLALLGWSPGNDRELFFQTRELIDAFTIEKLQEKAAIFDPKKLEWMNGQYMARAEPERLLPLIQPFLKEHSILINEWDRARALTIISQMRGRSRTTRQLADHVLARLVSFVPEPDQQGQQFIIKTGEPAHQALVDSGTALQKLGPEQWNPQMIEICLTEVALSSGIAKQVVFQAVRIASTGSIASEPTNELLSVIDREEALRRIQHSTETFKRVLGGHSTR